MNYPYILEATELPRLKEEPLVSVVIDCYNHGDFIRDAIDSVLEQSYRNFELIVVDNSSTDNSRDLIESYGNCLIAIFQANSGQEGALNTGITHSKGEIICFLDGDDYFHKDKLAKVVKAFQEHPNWLQVVHGKITVDRNGLPTGCGPKSFSQGDVRGLLLRWGRYVWETTSALSYRREALEKFLPIPFNGLNSADVYTTAVVPFLGQVGCVNEPLMFYRQHGNNVQSHNINLSNRIKMREVTAEYINAGAERAGIPQRFDIQKDSTYRSYIALQQGVVSGREALEIIWLSLRRNLAIRSRPRQILEELLQCIIFTFFPEEGLDFIRYGRRNYFRFKLLGRVPRTQATD
jgi:glycosyltransferase involved in cell wall biosynthesis